MRKLSKLRQRRARGWEDWSSLDRAQCAGPYRTRCIVEQSAIGWRSDWGKGHVDHPGPKPVQVYRVQSR